MKNLLLIILFLFSCFAAAQPNAVNDGDWETNATWQSGSSPGLTGLGAVNVNAYVIANSTLNFTGSNNDVNVNDTLIVYGDMVWGASSNRNEIIVGPTGVLVVLGSINLGKNNAGIEVQAGGVAVIRDGVTSTGTGPSTGEITGAGSVYTPSTNMDDSGSGGSNSILPIGELSEDGYGDIENFVAGGGAAPLPVELIDFTVTVEKYPTLSWSTSSELNNDFFAIERSDDGLNFYEIGRVSGHGNSNILQVYAYTDKANGASERYYRLRQVDYDGQFEIFEVKRIEVNLKEEWNPFTVYPTIVQEGILEIASEADFQLEAVSLHALSGQESKVLSPRVFQKRPNQVEISFEASPGLYLLQLITIDGNKIASRIIVQ